MTTLFETIQMIHQNEQQANGIIDPCFECGEPSEQYGEFDDGDFVCEACCARQESKMSHQDISRRQREIFEEVKAAAPTMPEDFDWDYAFLNSEGNAADSFSTDTDGEDFLACFKATLEVYVDQKVHTF